jgi:hypothetical protein
MTYEEIMKALPLVKDYDEQLDEELTLYLYPEDGIHLVTHANGLREWQNKNGWLVRMGTYTQSVDSALSLIPKNWRVMLLGEWDHERLRERGQWQCILGRSGESDFLGGKARCDNAYTMETAIISAALQARKMNAEKGLNPATGSPP